MYLRVYFRQGDKNKIIILNLLAMEDIQLIIYIIFVVVALLSRILKAKKQPPTPTKGSSYEREAPSQPVKSFEDLLREFTEGPTHRPAPVVAYEEEEEEEEEEDYFASRDAESHRIFQEAILATAPTESTESNVGLSDQDRLVKRFSEFEEEEESSKSLAELKAMLTQPDGARKAMVLAEILQRRY
jgi:hypothetical protein